MKNFRFINFWLLLTASMATVLFGSCSDNESKEDVFLPTPNGSLILDEGVVIDGVKWATRNVDSPGTFTVRIEDPGMFYQWNSNLGWSVAGPLVSSDTTITQWDNDWIGNNATAWEEANNPCPKGWRIPTVAELRKLAEAGGKWSTVNGVEGRIFGRGHNAIFLPAPGNRLYDGTLNNGNLIGNYWSNAQHGMTQATNMYFHSSYANLPPEGKNHADRAYGLSCRCVADPEADLNSAPDEDAD